MPVREELFEWLSNQDPWQQDLARRLAHSAELDDDEYPTALEMVRAAFAAATPGVAEQTPQPISLDDLPGGETTSAPRLVAFGNLRGVGAVASDQQIRFAPQGLTVIYGQNGAGKTSYVRALKRVCRTVDRDTQVRGNVFAETAGDPPTATIELAVGDEHRAQQLPLNSPPDLGLSAISVFDSRCAELYIDATNSIAYIPRALLTLTRLAAAQDRMRRDLATEVSALEAAAPSFPELDEGTQAAEFVRQLAADTSEEAITAATSLDEQQRERLQELRVALAARNTAAAQSDARAAERDADQAAALASAIEERLSAVGEESLTALRTAAATKRMAEEAISLAAREFSDLPVPGGGSDPWKAMWDAARSFVAEHSGAFPPTEGERCPLCMQTVDGEAAARLAHLQAHVEGALQEAADRARSELAGVMKEVSEETLDALRSDFVAGLSERAPELFARIESVTTALGNRLAMLRADPERPDLPDLPESPNDSIAEWEAGRRTHAATLLAALDPESEQALVAELGELEGREKLAQRLADVRQRVSDLKRIVALGEARTGLATNRLTSKQRELTDVAITQNLASNLVDELRNLHADYLPVHLSPQAAVAEPQVALQLAGAQGSPSVSEIASEGEQRAVSLAFFLAEVATSDSDGAIVVDDPVSSLDDERREYIAKRLVAESARRQVVVLTHDLPFMFDLLAEAERAEIPVVVQAIWRLGTEVGRVDDHAPFKAMRLRDRVGTLRTRVQEWDNQAPPADFDEAWRRVCDLYRDLRISWERAVEERLFKGVVQRFQRDVKTLKLPEVEVTPELIATIDQGMARCSMFVHDAPPAAATALPGRTQLAADLEGLVRFETSTR